MAVFKMAYIFDLFSFWLNDLEDRFAIKNGLKFDRLSPEGLRKGFI